MRWYANQLGYGEDADFWATVGLLHDIDFEQWPEQHCVKAQALLTEKPSSVIRCDKPPRNAEHPTMKPVVLCGRLIKNSSLPGQTVLDLFGGSGSTLIACEQLSRKCYTMEYDPRYVDVIVQRWEDFTGEKAVRLK